MPILIITSSDDSFVAEGSPNTNYNPSGLYVGSVGPNGGIHRVWVKFNISQIPAGSTITSASLKLKFDGIEWDSYNSAQFLVRKSTNTSWAESTITYNNAPDDTVSGTNTDTFSFPDGENTSTTRSLNVKSDVESSVGNTYITWRIHEINGLTFATMISKEMNTGFPELTINYSPPETTAGQSYTLLVIENNNIPLIIEGSNLPLILK